MDYRNPFHFLPPFNRTPVMVRAIQMLPDLWPDEHEPDYIFANMDEGQRGTLAAMEEEYTRATGTKDPEELYRTSLALRGFMQSLGFRPDFIDSRVPEHKQPKQKPQDLSSVLERLQAGVAGGSTEDEDEEQAETVERPYQWGGPVWRR